MPKLLTINEAALELRLHRQTVYRGCRDGILPAVKIGGVWRIDADRINDRFDGGRDAAELRDDS